MSLLLATSGVAPPVAIRQPSLLVARLVEAFPDVDLAAIWRVPGPPAVAVGAIPFLRARWDDTPEWSSPVLLRPGVPTPFRIPGLFARLYEEADWSAPAQLSTGRFAVQPIGLLYAARVLLHDATGQDESWPVRAQWMAPVSFLPPLPMGAVHIRYVIGQTENVVPVETVLTNEIGTVPCRVYVGPAHVVPVREAPAETPRVKIRLV